MITLKKTGSKPFVVLNLTDFQLEADEWTDKTEKGKEALKTIDTLYKRVKPDLVTLSGDLSWSGDFEALTNMGTLLDSYCVPWAPVFGNHDNDGGLETLDKAILLLSSFKYFTFEKGDESLGRGNYIISIEENEKIVHSIFMMDTHDRVASTNEDGKDALVWSSLNGAQIEWYKKKVKELKALGVPESTLIIHIPIYAYRDAWWAAYNPKYRAEDIPPKESSDIKYWNKGYEGSFGVRYEGVSSYPRDDGVFDAIKEMDHTKNILCGHSHTNTFSIPYKGVRFTFALKTARGSYHNKELNGGTVYEIDSYGNSTVRHEFVDLD